ncbi:U7 snRNA-associated Sm-like protein LSm10 [Gracilariopsis chorda]|uniref:U7 snRNA-associated Sm-like protein LSm10 n=1 Tax=Gracilariopsis chorda TaxID=448386 RepID=A0A2V3J738_9FLOR|nr:U7 snRNA-associated Sm-like protein LSm10 [Gracilariopsis chorda]|eukprot:PXF49170.1 U7 snRNA-associated Sm-like protein LSm10 [Gracilariopsis chorda]
MGSSTEQTTLVFFIKALCGRNLRFELRNGVCVEGELESVDQNMNVTIAHALWNCGQLGSLTKDRENVASVCFELLYVASRHITFIQIPDDVNVSETMDIYVS